MHHTSSHDAHVETDTTLTSRRLPGRGSQSRRPWTGVLDRWPTALAIALAGLMLEGGETDKTVSTFGNILLLLPLVYLIAAAMRRPGASWPVVILGSAVAVALPLLGVIAPSLVFVMVALVVLVWSAVGGQLQESGMLRVQAVGMVGFGALGLAALAVDPDLGRYVAAAGWFLHGFWDFVHLRLDRVVVRSYAEWCGVLDVLIAAELAFIV